MHRHAFLVVLVVLAGVVSTVSAVGGADKDPRKYFREPPDKAHAHFDLRYFKGDVDDKSQSLQRLVQAYLTMARSQHVETWLAHGTLLGWWWNGRIMPWDTDIDVQVGTQTLLWLGDHLNGTLYNHTYVNQAGVDETRAYLIDINRAARERVRGDGMNVIDGRFIDTRNGLFIDITAISEIHPQYDPGVWQCKNMHRYETRQIWPLRETEFEGVPALVPYDFERTLVEEYRAEALTRTEFEGYVTRKTFFNSQLTGLCRHRWSVDEKQWLAQRKKRRADGRWQGRTIQHLQEVEETKIP